MTGTSSHYDAIVIGGGPAGCTAAIVLARAMLRELQLENELKKLPHVPKFGAEFGFGNDPFTMTFSFTDGGLLPGEAVFNIERAVFDKMLIDQARAAGADVFEATGVNQIARLSEHDVEVVTATGQHIEARVIVDASGHG